MFGDRGLVRLVRAGGVMTREQSLKDAYEWIERISEHRDATDPIRAGLALLKDRLDVIGAALAEPAAVERRVSGVKTRRVKQDDSLCNAVRRASPKSRQYGPDAADRRKPEKETP